MSRVFNFCAGPAVLPEDVLKQAQAELLDYQGSGMSIMESSHRGKEYDPVHAEAIANLRKLLDIPEDFAVLFQTGGASGQFAIVPMNLLGPGETADYVVAGTWGAKAAKEAKTVGQVNLAADVAAGRPSVMPDPATWKLTPGAAYVHITSNETIEGSQMKAFPATASPLVADMSSDILSRPLDVRNFGLIYAGAQKNIGPAGVTLVIIRKDLAEKACAQRYPTILRYKTHVDENSLYNTPPVFPIYLVMLVTRWLLARGGLVAMQAVNAAKAKLLYDAINAIPFYRGTAAKEFRSDMNVTFRLPSEELEERFVKEASAQGMKGLKGHRAVGGIRASIYNAFPRAGVEALVAFMRYFAQRNG